MQSQPAQKLPPPDNLRLIYSVSCKMPAGNFFRSLRNNQVQVLADTRVRRHYPGVMFASERDLRGLCDLFNIGYQVHKELAPTDELRKALRQGEDREDPMAWTRYTNEYLRLLVQRKVLRELGPLHHLLYSSHTQVAFMCSCIKYENCHRGLLLAFLNYFVEGLEVKHLPTVTLGKKKEPYQFPRVIRGPVPILGYNETPEGGIL